VHPAKAGKLETSSKGGPSIKGVSKKDEFFNLFLTLVVLLFANGESSSKGETLIVSSFNYPHTRLRPFDLRYIRGLCPNLR